MFNVTGIKGAELVSPSAYEHLYREVLQATGSPEAAKKAVKQAQAALEDLYHRTMIACGGDATIANRVVFENTTRMFRLAALMPTIKGSNVVEAGKALREATELLRQAGYTNSRSFHPWLREHIKSDEVLRRAGFDPEEVRRYEYSWAYADVDALEAIARDIAARYRNPDGSAVDPVILEKLIKQGRETCKAWGVGAARRHELEAPQRPVGKAGTAQAEAGVAVAGMRAFRVQNMGMGMARRV
jgi:hypothetical protein